MVSPAVTLNAPFGAERSACPLFEDVRVEPAKTVPFIVITAPDACAAAVAIM